MSKVKFFRVRHIHWLNQSVEGRRPIVLTTPFHSHANPNTTWSSQNSRLAGTRRDSVRRSGMAANQTPRLDLANWMAKLPRKLRNVPLKSLVIPGTHDSGSFYLDRTSHISPDENWLIAIIIEVVLPVLKSAGINIELNQDGKDLVLNWAITQDLSFTEQLNNGVRYFDLRVAWRKSDQSFYFVHGLYGREVDPAMQEIAQWLDGHPYEVVLLDFNHLFVGKHDDALINILENKFGSMLCPKTIVPKGNAVDVTLANLWENQHQVIVFYSNEAADKHDNLWRDREYIFSPWPDAHDISTLLEHLKTLLDDRKSNKPHGHKESRFYVSQAILTPDGNTMLNNLFRTLKSALAIPAMPKILKWLEGKNGLNIVIADFVGPEFAQAVIKLNYPVSKPSEGDAHSYTPFTREAE